MKTATHTPGPWFWDKVSTGHCRHVIVDSEGFTIANPSPMGEADARLIAAAPEMLDALQRLVQAERERNEYPGFASAGNFVRATEAARAAIARATGAA